MPFVVPGLNVHSSNAVEPRDEPINDQTHLGLFWESPEPNQPLSLPSDVEQAWVGSDFAGRESLLPPENNVFLNFLPLSGESEIEEEPGIAACAG